MRFALRFDDIRGMGKDMRSAAQDLAAKGIAANYCVVPGLLDSDSALFLSDLARRNPRLVGIAPYGWMAANHGTASRPGEFGEFRKRMEQWDDIKRAVERMDRLFMRNWMRVFVAPSNSLDANTIDICKSNLFMAVSGKHSPYEKRALPDAGASVVINRPSLAAAIVRECEFILNVRDQAVIGVQPVGYAGVYLDEVKRAASVLVSRGVKSALLSDFAGPTFNVSDGFR